MIQAVGNPGPVHALLALWVTLCTFGVKNVPGFNCSTLNVLSGLMYIRRTVNLSKSCHYEEEAKSEQRYSQPRATTPYLSEPNESLAQNPSIHG